MAVSIMVSIDTFNDYILPAHNNKNIIPMKRNVNVYLFISLFCERITYFTQNKII